MDWPYYEQAQPFPAPPPRQQGYAPNVPGGWPGYDPLQTYGQHYSSDPLAAYALPIGRPPVASHARHQTHNASRRGQAYRHQRRSRAALPVKLYHHAHQRSRGSSSPARYYGHGSSTEEILTDASLDSDVSEAVSANSFVFNGSISDIGEGQTENGPIAIALAADIFEKPVGGRRKATAGPPSPYSSSGATIFSSKFIGDALPQWNYCTADLSVIALEDPVRLKREPLFRWVYVLVLLESSNANAFSHLHGQHPNLSSFIVGRLTSSAVVLASRM
ncbi:MAG: hypothetical protein LQ346_006621 [Caloplaca aetnensis]|nr:MAG: hypothetical protein LQ346_006621 [Caloplaca aetnensis]